MDDDTLTARLAACEVQITRLHRQQRRTLAAVGGGLALLGAAAVTGFTRRGVPARATLAMDSLRVRDLVVVDAAGTVRARVGGDLPDAVAANGRRIPRGQKAAGVLLYDAAGLERGGYVTFDRSGHVGLTLDTKQQMVASFLAGPDGGGLVQMTHGGAIQLQAGGNWVELRADSTEGARLNAVRAGQVVAQSPALTPAQQRATCAAMRDELLRQAQMRADAAAKTCGARMPAAACSACFGSAP